MEIDTHLLTNESENKQAEQKQTDRIREHVDSCQMGVGQRGWVKKVKELRSTTWLLQNSHVDVKDSLGNIVNNILIFILPDLCKIYRDDYLVSYVMYNHWGVQT